MSDSKPVLFDVEDRVATVTLNRPEAMNALDPETFAALADAWNEISENPEIWTEEFQRDLYKTCNTVVEHEDAFINLAFELGGVEGLEGKEVKEYIRYIADRRLSQLGLQPIFRIERNPLPWMDEILNGMEHTNFFENRATEYSKAATQGSWEEVWDD